MQGCKSFGMNCKTASTSRWMHGFKRFLNPSNVKHNFVLADLSQWAERPKREARHSLRQVLRLHVAIPPHRYANSWHSA
jgi:hypothetical protein